MTTLTADGRERTTYGEWAERTRRLGGALDALGIAADGRVATFAWNTARHLELYFAAPCSGRVLHTLNIRLFPEQLTTSSTTPRTRSSSSTARSAGCSGRWSTSSRPSRHSW